MKNIWKQLPKPIFALAPMEGVTDTVFRQVINHCGRPAVYFTEFTNVDGLFSKGRKEVEHRLIFDKSEKPIIVQFWGMDVENYKRAAEMAQNLGFDGIDINMGCPERNVVKRGACAGLIHNHELAGQIIASVRQNSDLPLSVKTRLGIKEIERESWIPFLLGQKLDALIVHLRTVREMSSVPAHWEQTEYIVEHRDKISPDTLILGNGDIESIFEAWEKIKNYKLDGAMIGRGIFKNPYLFNGKKTLDLLSFEERIDLLLRHASLFEQTWGKNKHFAILKKYFKIYTLGLPNASEIRSQLMETNNHTDVVNILQSYK